MFIDGREVPSELNPLSLNQVEAGMVDAYTPAKPSALVELEVVTAAEAARVYKMWESSADESFARQMADVQKVYGRPEAYVTTAFSAVPVADSVRGFYDELGQTAPPTGYIQADTMRATYYFNYELSGKTQPEDHHAEIARLSRELDARETVCVIDQFVASGATLAYAAVMLKQAGVNTVLGMRGRWYNQAQPADVDLQAVCSRYPQIRQRMTEIGQRACRVAFA